MEITINSSSIESFTINEKEINGILGNSEEIVNSLFLKYPKKIDKKEVNEKELLEYKKKISIIPKEIELKDYYLTVYEILLREIKERRLELKNTSKKINDSLKIVGLNQNIMDRRINSLSSSERKKLLLSLGLLSNPEIIVIEEPFDNIDIKNEKKLILLLQKIKDQYNKTIIFASQRSEKIYQYTSHLIIFKNNKIIIEGKTEDIMKKVEFLKEQKIDVPEIIEITYLARNKKKVKIDYHKDVRDIIKDIYKHV